jgi:hypothetical protein
VVRAVTLLHQAGVLLGEALLHQAAEALLGAAPVKEAVRPRQAAVVLPGEALLRQAAVLRPAQVAMVVKVAYCFLPEDPHFPAAWVTPLFYH